MARKRRGNGEKTRRTWTGQVKDKARARKGRGEVTGSWRCYRLSTVYREGFELACILEAGEGAVAFQRFAQRIDALDSVGARTEIDAAHSIIGEAANNEQVQR